MKLEGRVINIFNGMRISKSLSLATDYDYVLSDTHDSDTHVYTLSIERGGNWGYPYYTVYFDNTEVVLITNIRILPAPSSGDMYHICFYSSTVENQYVFIIHISGSRYQELVDEYTKGDIKLSRDQMWLVNRIKCISNSIKYPLGYTGIDESLKYSEPITIKIGKKLAPGIKLINAKDFFFMMYFDDIYVNIEQSYIIFKSNRRGSYWIECEINNKDLLKISREVVIQDILTQDN